MKGAQGVTGLVGKALAETPVRDTLAGVGAGLAEEGARQAGAGPLGQIAAAVGGGIGSYAGLSALPKSLDAAKMSIQQIKDFFLSKGYNISDEEAARAYEYYARGGDEAAAINNPVPEEARLDNGGPVSNAERMPETVEGNPALEAEAAAFKGQREPVAEDIFPTEESIKANEAGMEAKLAAEAKAFKNKPKETVETPKVEEPEYVPSQLEKDIVDHTNSLTEKWKNAPEVHVYDHLHDASEGINKKEEVEFSIHSYFIDSFTNDMANKDVNHFG